MAGNTFTHGMPLIRVSGKGRVESEGKCCRAGTVQYMVLYLQSIAHMMLDTGYRFGVQRWPLFNKPRRQSQLIQPVIQKLSHICFHVSPMGAEANCDAVW